jgi:cold shock CspA family protein
MQPQGLAFDAKVPRRMAEGRIKWYSPQLGHGFIVCRNPLGGVFMRSEDIAYGDLWSLGTGDEVTFEVVDAPRVKWREPSSRSPKNS